MLKFLQRLFWSQSGQVAVDAGQDQTDQGTGEAPTADPADNSTETGFEQSADTTQPAGQQTDPTFLDGAELDPTKLPAEVVPIFKNMQRAYNKKMEAIAEIRDKAATVDRFYTDPGFAQQTLVGWAAQNGYQLVPVGQQGQQAHGQGPVQPQAVEQVKAHLPPELQWMAEPLAGVMSSMMQQVLTPIQQQQQQQIQAKVNQEYEQQVQQLSEKFPHWQEHEDTMSDLFSFLTGPQQFHPQYGSKLQVLYDLATSKSSSMAEATRRVTAAGKNRTTMSRSAARPPIDLNQIGNAKTSKDAWEMAKRAALSQHGRGT